jgi:hypothetical protein
MRKGQLNKKSRGSMVKSAVQMPNQEQAQAKQDEIYLQSEVIRFK